ncbi:MAG: hypothetical protein ABI777_09870 [Betaproteobacteria bacterium]
MRKLPWLTLLIPLALPVLLSGCATWGPTWSELTGQRFNVTVLNRRPAIIDRVDDQGAFNNPNLIRVEPGMRRIVVQAPAPGWTGGPPLEVMMLNVEPCKRYYINAQFATAITQEWTPVVDYVEPIAGCQMPVSK